MKSFVMVLGIGILILAFYAIISTSTVVATTNASLPGQVISDTSMDDTLAYIFDRVSSSNSTSCKHNSSIVQSKPPGPKHDGSRCWVHL